MQKRPLLVKLMSLGLLAAPVAATMMVFSLNSYSLRNLPHGLVVGMALLAGGSLLVALGVWKVHIWGFATFFLFGLSVLGADVDFLVRHPASFNPWYLVDFLSIVAGSFVLLKKDIRGAFFNPRLRWWERAPRYQLTAQSHCRVRGKDVDTEILNVSATGCFVKLSTSVEPGETVSVVLPLKGFQIETEAKVVRASRSPEGFGLEFTDAGIFNKLKLNRALRGMALPA